MRCCRKVIIALVQGKTPTMIAQGGVCAKSQVHRVADRSIRHALVGLANRLEYKGENKFTYVDSMEFLRLIGASLKEHGYPPPTRRQELPMLALVERTGIRVARVCQLQSQFGIRLYRPKPTANCP